MKKETILEVMIKDHEKINDLLDSFEKCLNQDKLTLEKVFDAFFWELEKHLFTEEKVIFTLYEPEEQVEFHNIIPQLMKEHEKILNELNKLKRSIKLNKECESKQFMDLFLKHKNFEEESFYPKLDQTLDETTKEFIIARINEVKLDNSILKNIKVNCSECGKKLRIFEGYHHPKLDKRWLFCKTCYNKIDEKNIKKRSIGSNKWKCTVCNYVFDPEKGDPKNEVPAGTLFEELPDDWICPVYGAGKEKFKKLLKKTMILSN
jgi:rubredoxin/hemerythrin superfamily protein